jgi:hypothetical protein
MIKCPSVRQDDLQRAANSVLEIGETVVTNKSTAMTSSMAMKGFITIKDCKNVQIIEHV